MTSAPALGGSQQIAFDTSAAIAPGASLTSTPIDVACGGAFVAGTLFSLAGVLNIVCFADGVNYEVEVLLESSIDAGATWQTAASQVLIFAAVLAGVTPQMPMPLLGVLAFTLAPTADTVHFRYTVLNDASSGAPVLPNYNAAPGTLNNPVINFQLASA